MFNKTSINNSNTRTQFMKHTSNLAEYYNNIFSPEQIEEYLSYTKEKLKEKIMAATRITPKISASIDDSLNNGTEFIKYVATLIEHHSNIFPPEERKDAIEEYISYTTEKFKEKLKTQTSLASLTNNSSGSLAQVEQFSPKEKEEALLKYIECEDNIFKNKMNDLMSHTKCDPDTFKLDMLIPYAKARKIKDVEQHMNTIKDEETKISSTLNLYPVNENLHTELSIFLFFSLVELNQCWPIMGNGIFFTPRT